MNTKHSKPSAQAVVKDIRRATRKQYGAEEKIRIVLDVIVAATITATVIKFFISLSGYD